MHHQHNKHHVDQQQQFGTTSDYWSTATSTSRSEPSIYSQRQTQFDSLLLGQHRRQRRDFLSPERLASASTFASSRSPSSMLNQANDDYYLDVAQSLLQAQQQASEFDLRARLHHQLAPVGAQQQFSGPIFAPIDDTDDEEYLRALSGQIGLAQPQAALAGGFSNALVETPHVQAPLQHSFGLHSDSHRQQLISLHNQNQLSSLKLINDDYDDYAIPTDEHCCRLDRSQVELVQLIGEGQKGYVFLGKLQSKDGQRIIDVAIKTLKYETDQLIDRLMSEAAMMRQLEHPHIIRFIGVCPETPALIAMELALFGEVRHYLKTYRHLIRVSQLILFTFQISTALSYLESKHYVHRDVAARNVLVCSHNCVKLADFDLTRNLQQLQNQRPVSRGASKLGQQQQQQQLEVDFGPDQDQEYISAPRVKLPVRWLAPESLIFRRFTSASDVWMFAVCSWELFQFVQVKPWPQLRNNQVLFAIESGQRLPKPTSCPSRLYQLLLSCWHFVPNMRPKFREIKQSIWSIYLSERTREQTQFEQLVKRDRQRLTAAHSFEAGQARAPAAQLIPLLVERGQRRRLASPPSDQLSATTATTPTELINTDYEAQPAYSSGANSLVGSMSRSGAKLKQQRRQQLQLAQRADQMNRFERCSSQAISRRNQLQKQRSQGTIAQLRDEPHSVEQRHRDEPRRVPNYPADDAALLSSKRGNNLSYDHWYARQIMLANSESMDEDEGDYKCDTPTRAPGELGATRREKGARKLANQPPSATPETNRITGAQIRAAQRSGAQTPDEKPSKRLSNKIEVSIESPANNRPISWQLHIQPPNAADQQLHRGRCAPTNYSRQSTGQRQQQPTRFSTDSPLAKIQEHNQLGQVLQTLCLSPTRSKSKSPPAQQVRVFSRQIGDQQGAGDTSGAQVSQRRQHQAGADLGETGDGQRETAKSAASSQLQLHKRLLGRIKLASKSAAPAVVAAAARQQQTRAESQKPTSGKLKPSNNNVAPATMRVETVDQSLEILQSLISNENLQPRGAKPGFQFLGAAAAPSARGQSGPDQARPHRQVQ